MDMGVPPPPAKEILGSARPWAILCEHLSREEDVKDTTLRTTPLRFVTNYVARVADSRNLKVNAHSGSLKEQEV